MKQQKVAIIADVAKEFKKLPEDAKLYVQGVMQGIMLQIEKQKAS